MKTGHLPHGKSSTWPLHSRQQFGMMGQTRRRQRWQVNTALPGLAIGQEVSR